MHKFFLAITLSSSILFAQAQTPKKVVKATNASKPATAVAATSSAITLKTALDSASYSLGLNIARNLKSQDLGNVNLSLLSKGMSDIFEGKTSPITDEEANKVIGSYMQGQKSMKGDANKKAGKAFLDKNGKRPGVKTLASGIQYEVLKTGNDTSKPRLVDTVKCHYHGTLIDGTVFDSSVDRGEPVSFPLNGVIKGWQESLQLMTVGSKWKIFIPSDLAYGDNSPSPKIGAGATLVFEVELLEIKKSSSPQ